MQRRQRPADLFVAAVAQGADQVALEALGVLVEQPAHERRRRRLGKCAQAQRAEKVLVAGEILAAGDRVVEADTGVREPPGLAQQVAAQRPRGAEPGIERQRALVGDQRIERARQVLQRLADGQLHARVTRARPRLALERGERARVIDEGRHGVRALLFSASMRRRTSRTQSTK